MESGQIWIGRKLFDTAALIDETEEENSNLYAGITFIFSPVELPTVIADKDKIGQVIIISLVTPSKVTEC